MSAGNLQFVASLDLTQVQASLKQLAPIMKAQAAELNKMQAAGQQGTAGYAAAMQKLGALSAQMVTLLGQQNKLQAANTQAAQGAATAGQATAAAAAATAAHTKAAGMSAAELKTALDAAEAAVNKAAAAAGRLGQATKASGMSAADFKAAFDAIEAQMDKAAGSAAKIKKNSGGGSDEVNKLNTQVQKSNTLSQQLGAVWRGNRGIMREATTIAAAGAAIFGSLYAAANKASSLYDAKLTENHSATGMVAAQATLDASMARLGTHVEAVFGKELMQVAGLLDRIAALPKGVLETAVKVGEVAALAGAIAMVMPALQGLAVVMTSGPMLLMGALLMGVEVGNVAAQVLVKIVEALLHGFGMFQEATQGIFNKFIDGFGSLIEKFLRALPNGIGNEAADGIAARKAELKDQWATSAQGWKTITLDAPELGEVLKNVGEKIVELTGGLEDKLPQGIRDLIAALRNPPAPGTGPNVGANGLTSNTNDKLIAINRDRARQETSFREETANADAEYRNRRLASGREFTAAREEMEHAAEERGREHNQKLRDLNAELDTIEVERTKVYAEAAARLRDINHEHAERIYELRKDRDRNASGFEESKITAEGSEASRKTQQGLADKRADVARELADKLADTEREAGDRRRDIDRQQQDRILEIDRRADDARADLARQHAREMAQIAWDEAVQVSELRAKGGAGMAAAIAHAEADAARKRAAAAASGTDERRRIDRERQEGLADANRAHAEGIADAERGRAERIAVAEREASEQLAVAQRAATEQIQAQEIASAERLRVLHEEEARRRDDIDHQIAEENLKYSNQTADLTRETTARIADLDRHRTEVQNHLKDEDAAYNSFDLDQKRRWREQVAAHKTAMDDMTRAEIAALLSRARAHAAAGEDTQRQINELILQDLSSQTGSTNREELIQNAMALNTGYKPLTGGMGQTTGAAAAAAAMVATPAHALGTDDAPGGPTRVGDGGAPEWVRLGAGLVNLPPHSMVLNATRDVGNIAGGLSSSLSVRGSQVTIIGEMDGHMRALAGEVRGLLRDLDGRIEGSVSRHMGSANRLSRYRGPA